MIGILRSHFAQLPPEMLSARFDHVRPWVGTGESLPLFMRDAKPASFTTRAASASIAVSASYVRWNCAARAPEAVRSSSPRPSIR